MTPWQGRLDLVFARQGDRTILRHCHSEAPFKMQRPFYPEGPAICHGAMLHTAGGLVGGDRLHQTITLEPEAEAVLTTVSAGKVYRSTGEAAIQEVDIHLGPGSRLAYLPLETILFQSAILQQRLKIHLAPGAQWFGWEMQRFGRTARGERFTEGFWRSAVEIYDTHDRPLWIDRQQFRGDPQRWQGLNGLDGQPVIATLSAFGEDCGEDLLRAIRDRLPASFPQGEGGCSTIEGGIIVRYRGASVHEARHWFMAIWQILRENQKQPVPLSSRLWSR